MKNFAHKQGKLFLRSAIAVAVASTFAPGSALAQEAAAPPAPASDSQQLDVIEVTGSRIPRPQLDSASPVTVIEREEILATGITDVGDLLQRLPSMSGSPIGTTTNNGGDGSVQIDLRGMGVNRTLTLINGRRLVDGGDYQTIPASMIERVEILKDGGSTIYGADAVAGVVNIITRKDFDGAELNVQNNDWFDIDGGAQTSYNVVTGKSFDGGHFVFGAEYVDQTEAYQSDTPWDFFQNSYYIYPEGCEAQVAAPYNGTPQGGCYPVGSSRITEGRLVFMTAAQGGSGQGTYMNPDGTGIVPYDGRTYNFAPVNYIQTPYQRTNVFMTGDFELNKFVSFGTEVRGNFRRSAQELAPTPYDSPTDPAYDGFFDNGVTLVPYHGISEANYYLVQATTAAGLQAEPVTNARRRMHEQPRRFTQDVTQAQAVFSLSGKLMDVSWDASYNRGYRSQISRDFGQFAGSRLSKALGPSADLEDATGAPGTDGVPECYADATDPATKIEGCVPLNLFGGPNSVTPAMYNYINANTVDAVKIDLDEIGLNFNGHALALPGGPLGWAAGFSYLGQEAEFDPDSNKTLDEVTGNTGAGTEGALYANAFMGELFAPVFDNGEQSAGLTAGVRFDDYNRFGSETTWKLGAEFNALKTLKFRATAATVFRAPTIGDLFGGVVDSFPTYTDPCAVGAGPLPPGCAQVAPAPTDSQVLAKVGGNPNLTPETGDTFTVGVVFEPKLPFGTFSATLDYWDIKIEDGISSLGVQFALDDCANNSSPQSCALVTRNSDYSVAQVRDTSLNVAEQSAKGIDTELRFGFSPGIGRLETALLWTHQLERIKVPFAGAAEVDLSGRYTDPTAEDGGAYATDKFNYSFKWGLPNVGPGNLTVSYLGEYISALDADTFCNCDSDGNPANNDPVDGSYTQAIDAVLYHDLVAELELPFGMKLMGGITNVTDEEPPFIEVGFNATTDPSTYRMFGQGYFLRVAQEFR